MTRRGGDMALLLIAFVSSINGMVAGKQNSISFFIAPRNNFESDVFYFLNIKIALTYKMLLFKIKLSVCRERQ